MISLNTKERIIEVALELFAEEGYSAVSVQRIAEEVGIQAPSLYKHYKSKEAIFDAAVDLATNKYKDYLTVNTKKSENVFLGGINPNEDIGFYKKVDEETLSQMLIALFRYFANDPYAKNLRKILNLEQYRNADMAKLYTKLYLDNVLDYQAHLFSQIWPDLAKEGYDYKTIALHFYSPIYTLLLLYDRTPSRLEHIENQLEQHVKQFTKLYRRSE